MYSFINCSIHFLFALHWAMFNWFFFHFLKDGSSFYYAWILLIDFTGIKSDRSHMHLFYVSWKKNQTTGTTKKRYKKRPLHNEISTDEMNFNGIYFLFPAVHTLPSPIRSFFLSFLFLAPTVGRYCKQKFFHTHRQNPTKSKCDFQKKNRTNTHIECIHLFLNSKQTTTALFCNSFLS